MVEIAILPYAIDRQDQTASLHVACDANGNELDYFHSLNRIPVHEYFRHARCLEVRCRSLASLMAAGEIDADIGLLKIDTEGNDLRVLQGLGALRPELVVCEFVPPAVYPEWPLSFAENLVPEARARLDDPRIIVEETAVAAAAGSAEFLFGDDTATGSILPPAGPTPAATQSRSVPTTSQGDPAAVISWLAERGYRLVGFFDEHFSREGWLAWTDACFVPVARQSEYRSPFGLRGTVD